MKGWIGIAFLLIATPVLAEELPVFYKGVRPLGMGGAFTAVADDENALFYNPAGLNNIEGWGGLEILNPYFEFTQNTLDFFGDVDELADASEEEQSELAAELLENWLGEKLHLRTGLFPNFTVHNFGVGVLAQGLFNGEVHNPLGSNTLVVTGGYDLALLVSGAYGFDMMLGTLKIGATGKLIQRQLLDQTYTTRELVEEDGIDPRDDLEKGVGFGADLGAIYSVPVFLNPSFGFTIQNIADTDLGDAGELQQQLNLGAALKPTIGFGTLVVALDVVDFTNQLGNDSDLAKRLHLGVEYRLPLFFSFRAGFHQGYLSAGATADLWFVKLAYAYYIEELGAYAGQEPDRRHIAQLSLGF
jgi:hypothetical protein